MSKLKDTLLMMAEQKEVFEIGNKKFQIIEVVEAEQQQPDYSHLWELMNEINIIMWESYMIEGKEFGRTEGYKIMGRLEQWAERH